jgi:23S rRNA (adenine2503-C2)-methyltransferase
VIRDIKSLFRSELETLFQSWGEPSYRVDQLLKCLYEQRVSTWDEMTNLPKSLRSRLATEFSFNKLALVHVKGQQALTQKFLWRLPDNHLIESVLMPANPALYGKASDRRTLCVSTQVGCAYGCKFCASGLDGWKRNLNVAEIVGQITAAEQYLTATQDHKQGGGKVSKIIDNLVIMGMGEPLANYANLLPALTIINASWACHIGARKITISTCGLAPQIRRLADEANQFRLAVSLHASTDDIRNRIMPINKKYPLAELVAACKYYIDKKGRMITLEYVLIDDVNDSPQQLQGLIRISQLLKAKVNLIPYNEVRQLRWSRPSLATQNLFYKTLKHNKVPVTMRREKGPDIEAACGQLRLLSSDAFQDHAKSTTSKISK